MISRIYLIRHGKTDGNRNHWYYGSTDLPLTDIGEEELRAYAEQGIYPEVPDDADFYTTGLIRTDQTLEATYGKRSHEAIPRLQEIGFGKAECMTYDELKKFENFEKWSWDTTGKVRIVDDAETADEFHERIHAGLDELLKKHHLKEEAQSRAGRDAVSVVVCHGGVIACIMEKLFPAVCGSMWDWLPEPGFGYAVDFQDGEPYMYSKINDIGRLGLGLYRLPLRNRSWVPKNNPLARPVKGKERARQINHKKTKALIDTQMSKGHGYFELEFLAWPDEQDEVSLKRKYRAIREDLVDRFDRSRYYLTALVDASMLGEVYDLISLTGVDHLDRLTICGIEKYYEDYPEDASIEPETLADKRIDGPEGKSGRPADTRLEDVWAALRLFKEESLINKAGLAFSGSATLLDDLLRDRQEIDYVELPVNYRMGFSEGDLAQKYYTISRRRYKEILVRSPFAGGKLAKLDEDAFRNEGDLLYKQEVSSGDADEGQEDAARSKETLRKTMAGYALLKKDHAPKSAVDWALRYVLSFPFVVTCVATSGDPEHAEEDMDAAERFRPLSEEDRGRLKKAAERL